MGADNSNGNGTIVNLTFRVKNNAAEGNYTIFLTSEEAYNSAFDDVTFTVTNGIISISQPSVTKLLGDVDGNGEVTIIDATLLQRYLVELNVNAFDSEAADTDGDGDISIADATFIQRWLAQIPTPYNIGDPIK